MTSGLKRLLPALLLTCLFSGARAQEWLPDLITGTSLPVYHVSWDPTTLAIPFTAENGGLQDSEDGREELMAYLQYLLELSTGYEEGMTVWEVIIDDDYSGTILLDLPHASADRELVLDLLNVTITIRQSGEGNFQPFDLSASGSLANGGSVTLTLEGSELGVTYELLKDGQVVRSFQGDGGPVTTRGITSPGRYFLRATNGTHAVNIATCLVEAPPGGGNEGDSNGGDAGGEGNGDNENTGGDPPPVAGVVPSTYKVVKRYLDPTTTAGTGARTVTDVVYQDGLGRTVQEVAVGASPTGGDIVRPVKHGAFGREEKSFLPFVKAANNGAFVQDAFNPSNWNSSRGETEAPYAYSETVHDDSPLNRKLRAMGAGKAWKAGNKATRFAYLLNETNEVRKWRITATDSLYSPGFYPPGGLSKHVVTDEDGKKLTTFKDGSGRVVLTVQHDGETALRTYLVHDDLNRLRVVIPPAVGDKAILTREDLDRYCFQYKHDRRGLLVEKKLPGVAPVYLLHDRRHCLVLSQDGNQRESNTWCYHLHDIAKRVIESGEVVISTPLETLREIVAATENYTPGNRLPLLYSHHDSYRFDGVMPFDSTRNISAHEDQDVNRNGHEDVAPGMITGSKVRVLEETGERWITTTTYYDYKRRPIQVITSLYPAGTGVVSTRYDFTGNVLQRKEWQTIDGVTTTVESNFTYDDRGRLLASRMKINDGEEITLSEQAYDALGRLSSRKYHEGIETLAYSYNARDWLTGIKGEMFEEAIGYETLLANLDGVPCYNGNISTVTWRNGNGEQQAYSYTYDGLNRLTVAAYNSGWTGSGKYSVSGITYDKNGNILTLRRNNNGTGVDDLAYRYTGNQLQNVTDASGNASGYPATTSTLADQRYSYDPNGNMTKDLNKNISNIAYNYLNLPRQITINNNTMKYVYSATGEKLAVQYTTGNVLTYNGGMVRDGNNSLKYILTGEGRYVMNGTSGTMEYHLADHLGNTRVVLNQAGEVIQANDYYPFGMLMAQSGSSTNRYLYNGKEAQEQTGWLDYGARMYDASLGRWFNMDPMAEEYTNLSPYNYCANNVVNAVDLEGKLIIFINGNHYGDGGKADYWETWNISMTRSGPGIDGTKVFFK